MIYPVLETLPQLKEVLSKHIIAILQAPPGAGKSTILPLELLGEEWLGDRKIIMLEPRKLAAKSVAQRMASLRKEEIGETVGYRVRFDTRVRSQTTLEVVTEGILTRMIQSDNSLEGVRLVIFDEFHERSLQADLALALCLQVQSVLRPDLRILIMSATLDADIIKKSLGEVPVITSEGRQFPVSVHYLNLKEEEPLHLRMISAVRKALREEQGDVLVFLPGAGEIQRTANALEELNLGVRVHMLFADLSYKQQEEALLPDAGGQRKVVLSTSIAETSLTIEGIKVVIDSGYARVPRFDVRSGLTRLETIRVTKDSADQRKGRAGRLGPGVCYRLWSENLSLAAQRKPEILEADLAPMVLELMQWGVKDVHELTWITTPPVGAWNQAKELLEQLGAIENNSITEQGKAMLKLPTHPRIAHMLTSPHSTLHPDSREDKGVLVSLACDLAAVIEERDPLQKESGADLALRIEALRKFRKGDRYFADRSALARIEKLATQWRKLLNVEIDNTEIEDHHIGKLLSAAYPERIAQQLEKHGERYKLANGRVVKLPQHDVLSREPWLCVAQLDAGQKEGKIFLAAAIDQQGLLPLSTKNEIAFWDEEREMVAAATEWRLDNLVVDKKAMAKPTAEKAMAILCAVIRGKGLKFIGWNEQHANWQARLTSIKIWRQNEVWPAVTDEHLMDTLEDWLAPYLDTLYKRSELLKLDLLTILQSSLPWELSSRLDSLVPQKLLVPSGSSIDLQYFNDARPPVMEVRLQEMFGLLETPTVNEGRNKIMLRLLSPGYKPVQVTQDLKSFWQNTYHDVRKELRMRYPKHHWPEDPWTAEAVRGVKRKPHS
jgi:ATP-dependent helicase HrpB